MKYHYLSMLVVLAGITAVLGGSFSASVAGAAAEQRSSLPSVAAMSGKGIVEAIHLANTTPVDPVLVVMHDTLIGHVMRQDSFTRPVYRIRVRMGDGSVQTIVQDSVDGLAVGAPVHLDSGRVYSS